MIFKNAFSQGGCEVLYVLGAVEDSLPRFLIRLQLTPVKTPLQYKTIY